MGGKKRGQPELSPFYVCAGHGAVLAGESPVMDNLPFM